MAMDLNLSPTLMDCLGPEMLAFWMKVQTLNRERVRSKFPESLSDHRALLTRKLTMLLSRLKEESWK